MDPAMDRVPTYRVLDLSAAAAERRANAGVGEVDAGRVDLCKVRLRPASATAFALLAMAARGHNFLDLPPRRC